MTSGMMGLGICGYGYEGVELPKRFLGGRTGPVHEDR